MLDDTMVGQRARNLILDAVETDKGIVSGTDIARALADDWRPTFTQKPENAFQGGMEQLEKHLPDLGELFGDVQVPCSKCFSDATMHAKQSATGQDMGSQMKAVHQWFAVWCYEHAYKVEMSDTKSMIEEAVRQAGGTLSRKKSPNVFHEWWLSTENSNAPYVLILHWREAKPCFDLLEKELSQGHIEKMPQAIYVVSRAGKAYRQALSWASSCKLKLEPTVVPEMTRDSLKAWLFGCLSKGLGGVLQHDPESLAGYDAAGYDNELLQCHDKLQTTDWCKLQRSSIRASHEHAPSQMVFVSSQQQREELPIKIHTSTATVQFSYVTCDLDFRNPCLSSWLTSLLVENIPERYED